MEFTKSWGFTAEAVAADWYSSDELRRWTDKAVEGALRDALAIHNQGAISFHLTVSIDEDA